MIKIPDTELSRRLKAIQPKDDDPASKYLARKEHDQVLSAAWKQLAGPAKDALDYFLAGLEAETVQRLQSPELSESQRQFAAGQANMVYLIQTNIQAFQDFDPEQGDYEDPQFGDPDATEGLDDERAH